MSSLISQAANLLRAGLSNQTTSNPSTTSLPSGLAGLNLPQVSPSVAQNPGVTAANFVTDLMNKIVNDPKTPGRLVTAAIVSAVMEGIKDTPEQLRKKEEEKERQNKLAAEEKTKKVAELLAAQEQENRKIKAELDKEKSNKEHARRILTRLNGGILPVDPIPDIQVTSASLSSSRDGKVNS